MRDDPSISGKKKIVKKFCEGKWNMGWGGISERTNYGAVANQVFLRIFCDSKFFER
jgi:hypothetical protein